MLDRKEFCDGDTLEASAATGGDKENAPTIALHHQHSASKRTFLRGVALAALASLAKIPAMAYQKAERPLNKPRRRPAPATTTGGGRAERAFNLRVKVAQMQKRIAIPTQKSNGDEELYPNKIANFSKGLPHNDLAEVDIRAYDSMTQALTTCDPSDFEKIRLGNVQKLVNPQAGLAYELQGPDPHSLAMKPAPAFSSAEEAADIAENYWMALTRDVPFSAYLTDPLINEAAADLSKFSDFKGPKINGKLVPEALFRGNAPGATTGPIISQFLWKETLFGPEKIGRQMRTAKPGIDYLTDYREWLDMQNGNMPWPDQYDVEPRYIRNGRDLGQWVHYDILFQAYFDALLVLFRMGARHDAANPYKSSRTQIGFGTLGNPYITSLVCAVATRALKAVWYQKWYVHRRLRPEEFAGRIHNHMIGAANYPIHREILNSAVLDRLFRNSGTYLLPQAYPEGAPAHPSYGAGHATVAGACVTILKAFFDESFVIRGPVESAPDGLSLVPYSGPEMTVGGELNKLAYNVALGRNFAGVHWRTDAEESLRLGEEVGIGFLREERYCLNEQVKGFSLTKFDGTTITI